MTLDRTVLLFAGVMVLLSVVLTAFVSPLFMWFTVFHRCEPDPILVYRLLPGGSGVPEIGHQNRLCLQLRSDSARFVA